MEFTNSSWESKHHSQCSSGQSHESTVARQLGNRNGDCKLANDGWLKVFKEDKVGKGRIMGETKIAGHKMMI